MVNFPASIKIVHGRRGATQARGIAVVIDVLRAFSTACYVMAAGARRVMAVADADAALNMKRQYPGAILIGERRGYRLAGFDMGNSPSQVPRFDWQDRAAILTTTNGTLGLAAARNADEVLTGSFVNAGAVATYIKRQTPSLVSLVCMGSANRPVMEDTLCAEYLRDRLMNKTPNFEPIRRKIWQGPEAAKFLNGHSDDLPPEDLKLCVDLDRFDFVLKATQDTTNSISLACVANRSSKQC